MSKFTYFLINTPQDREDWCNEYKLTVASIVPSETYPIVIRFNSIRKMSAFMPLSKCTPTYKDYSGDVGTYAKWAELAEPYTSKPVYEL